MDTRRDPRSRERQDAPREVSTDTVPVELVDIHSVGKENPGSRRGTFVIVGVVAVLAVAAIGSALNGPQPSPSPSAPGVALASPSASAPAPSPTPTRRPVPTPRPTPAITPAPTPAPTYPWTWTRSQLHVEPDVDFRGLWPAGDAFLSMWSTYAGNRDIWQAGALPPGEPYAWLVPVPAAMDRLGGAFANDGRVWVFARVTGISEVTWQMVSTADGEKWASLGVAQGLPAIQAVRIVGRAGSSWVADGSFRLEGEGFSPTTLLWSRDGIHWNEIQLPPGDPLGYFNSAMLGDKLLVLGSTQHQEGENFTYVLTSADGSTWRKVALDIPEGANPSDMACGPDFCVIALEAYEGPPTTTRQVMVSNDAEQWSIVDIELPMAAQGEGVRQMTATPSGLIGMAGGSGYALLTSDGHAWHAVEVLPADQIVPIWTIAVNGDAVFAYARQEDAENNMTQLLFQGSLAAMDAAE